ncbi:DUF1353 domain-containing protein [Novosphingobium flavum]|uniref:DUF1353 domain-containing protein n=1 Tax=Novosphingobium aerophilum TaxID=2839843 RepID=UPI00163B3ADE|nr:DUF1353 domain-containing protein [Novosphingobium aerophilum]MBC2662836.1 DUF1353 domain-containing protein [Novosphingobium aerophilum]
MLVIDTSDNTSASIASLQARGVTAVGRYYSSNAWKRLTAQEARSVSLAGIKLFTVFEDKGDPELTIEKGVFDGQIAIQQARAIGQPEGSAIYFALEHLPHGYSKSHVPGAKLYIEGVRQALADLYAVGVYSNGVVLEAMLDTGLCEFAWLSASRAFEGSKAFYASRRWVIAQDPKVDQNWGGLSVDINEVQGSFGAFDVTQTLDTKRLSNGTAAFSGEPKAVWLTNSGRDRTMRIVEDFWFRDRSGKVWEAPAGTVVDGASIPKPLWSTVGSPYTGDYRRASIVHDLACVLAQGSNTDRRTADRMFYEACRAGGCSAFEATILYIGVRIGALAYLVPAWRRAMEPEIRPAIHRTPSQARLEADFQIAAELVTGEGEVDDPIEIETRTDVALSAVSALDLVGQ